MSSIESTKSDLVRQLAALPERGRPGSFPRPVTQDAKKSDQHDPRVRAGRPRAARPRLLPRSEVPRKARRLRAAHRARARAGRDRRRSARRGRRRRRSRRRSRRCSGPRSRTADDDEDLQQAVAHGPRDARARASTGTSGSRPSAPRTPGEVVVSQPSYFDRLVQADRHGPARDVEGLAAWPGTSTTSPTSSARSWWTRTSPSTATKLRGVPAAAPPLEAGRGRRPAGAGRGGRQALRREALSPRGQGAHGRPSSRT